MTYISGLGILIQFQPVFAFQLSTGRLHLALETLEQQ